MTNYNDGKWHGWNGGECPVHPESVVEAVWHDANQETTGIRKGPALGGAWRGQIVKFRVVKEHREPRECWSVGKHMHDSLADAEAFRAQLDANHPGNGYLDTPITHWREVVD